MDDTDKTERRSPTDVLIELLEKAENMTDVIVIYRMKPSSNNDGILCWDSTVLSTTEKVGTLEETKVNIIRNAYSHSPEKD